MLKELMMIMQKCTAVTNEAGDVAAAMNNVKNSGLPFATNEGKVTYSCGYLNSALQTT